MATQLDTLTAPVAAPPDEWSARAGLPTDERGDSDLGRRLGVLAIGLRWLAVAVGAIVAIGRPIDVVVLASISSLAAFALFMAVQRPQLDPPDRTLPYLVVIELLLSTIAVSVTGGTQSPFILTPAIAIVLAGYTFTERQVLAFAYGGAAAVAVLAFLGNVSTTGSQSIVFIGTMYVLCGALGAFTRRIATDMARRHAAARDQLERMGKANELLVALHGLAQSLPASLDLAEVVVATRARLRAMFDATVLTLFVRDPASGRWRAELAEGARVGTDLSTADLPAPVLGALTTTTPRLVHDHVADRVRGISPFSRSGLYIALRSRGSLVGALAVEHEKPEVYGAAAADVMSSIAGPVALAVDNAMLFARLRILGAETERARIARELHDRVAQSLVYVTFELERLTANDSPAERRVLVELHDVVHSLVAELRDTLADLRATVTATDDLPTVARRQLERLSRRYDVPIDFHPRIRASLPLTVEQELWRILQEAVHNVGRHARAQRVTVRYEVSHSRTVLEIRDDGRGFAPASITGDHFGLVGMRERAAAIGAALEIDTAPGRGTTVRVELEEST